MNKYRCIVCGWNYDSAKGDPDSGIKLGMPFEHLQDNYICPVCVGFQDQFERVYE